MKLLKRKEKLKDTVEDEKKELKNDRAKRAQKPLLEKPRDPTRWLSLLFLLIFLFISYLSWVAF